MNADDLRAAAALIEAIDKASSAHSLTLTGRATVGDASGDARLGVLVFNDGSETTWEES
jgi:hypothetical protein